MWVCDFSVINIVRISKKGISLWTYEIEIQNIDTYEEKLTVSRKVGDNPHVG